MANTKITNPELFNLGDSTLATQLPVMTTTQRIAMNAPPTLTVDYLVVAGGGGGGNSQGASGSGGGAGEYLYQTGQSLTTGGSGYTVTVGAGGSGGTGSSYPSANGLSGSDSFFVRSVAGGGAGLFSSPGNLLQSVPGGSGGGARPGSGSGAASTAFAPGVGNAGGSSSGNGGGGGGGAGSPGTTGTTSLSGSGGNGLQNSITGVSTYYAGGGAGGNFAPTGGSIGSGGSGIGGTSSYTGTAGSGVNNTGSGGAGGSYANSTNPYIPYAGGDGGSGVVILRYATADIASYTTTGITPTEDTTTIPGQTILSFTTVGTGTINFTGALIPGTPPMTDGEMIFNSTTDKVEYWDGTKWYGITYEVQEETPYNNVLYPGSGDTTNGQSITGVGFEPDLVWIKSINDSYYNVLYDSIRGTNDAISSNLTNSTYSNYNRFQSFDDDGFTIKANNAADLWKIDRGNTNFVAWCFKAGGAAVPNTNGSITSQVSANVAGGFSIVKYSGGNSSGTTVGHGLSSAPELIITKNTSKSSSWPVFLTGGIAMNSSTFTLEGSSQYLALNSTTNFLSYSFDSQFGGTANSGSSSQNIISYCFHSVPGYSKIGSYPGNGSTSPGNTIDLGFEPSWIMIKNTTTAGSSSGWFMIDNKRNTSDPWNKYIFANSSAAEGTTTQSLTSVGATSFTVKSSGRAINYNGDNYIYLAFA